MKTRTIILTTVAAVTLGGGLAQVQAQDGKKERGQRPDGGTPPELLERFDADKDGKLSQEEREAAQKARGDRPGGEGGERPEGERRRPDGERPEGEPRRPGRGGELFNRMDKNSDGKLTQEEVPGELWERVSKADKNADGAVAREELAGMGGPGGDRPGRPGGGNPGGGDIISQMDKDSDGKLSKDEVPERMWERVSKADDDGDGLVSKAELEKAMSSGEMPTPPTPPTGERPEGGRGFPGTPEEMFSRMDKNTDQKLTSDEVPEQFWSRLSQADKDGDSAVSKEEFLASRPPGGRPGEGRPGGEGRRPGGDRPEGKPRPGGEGDSDAPKRPALESEA